MPCPGGIAISKFKVFQYIWKKILSVKLNVVLTQVQNKSI